LRFKRATGRIPASYQPVPSAGLKARQMIAPGHLSAEAGRDVGKPYMICQRGDELVATGGEGGGDAGDFGREAGEEQHPPAGNGDGLLRRQALRQAARGAQDDRGIAAQEDAETFFLHRRLEAAYDAAAFVVLLCCLVVGA